MHDGDDTQPLLVEETDPLLDSDDNVITSLDSVTIRTPSPWTGPLILAISVAIIGSSFQFGFQTGCMANTIDKVSQKLTLDNTTKTLIISGNAIGGLIGGLSAGPMADRIGRKKLMLINNIPVIVGTVLMSTAFDKYLFLIGRIVLGIASGVATGVAPMYIAEISPVSIKGAVGVSHQFMITFGILVGFLLSISKVLNSFPAYWHLYFALPALPALYQLILLPLCPESPNWLYFNKEREDLSRQALTKLRKSSELANLELDDMIKERTTASDSVMVSYKQLLTDPTLRLTLIIGIALQGAQQLSGVNAILNYGPVILRDAGMSDPDLATGLLGGINVLMTLISVPLMDRLGRRTLMLVGQGFMIVSYIGLGMAQTLHSQHKLQSSYHWTSAVSVVTVISFIIFFAIGPGSIPWLIIGEIFTAEARGKAGSICVGANWSFNLLVVITYDSLNNALYPYTFFLYMGIVTFFTIFTFFFVRETKQKPVEQINRELTEQASRCPPTVF